MGKGFFFLVVVVLVQLKCSDISSSGGMKLRVDDG